MFINDASTDTSYDISHVFSFGNHLGATGQVSQAPHAVAIRAVRLCACTPEQPTQIRQHTGRCTSSIKFYQTVVPPALRSQQSTLHDTSITCTHQDHLFIRDL